MLSRKKRKLNTYPCPFVNSKCVNSPIQIPGETLIPGGRGEGGKERNSVGKDVAPIEAERRKSKNLGIPYPL